MAATTFTEGYLAALLARASERISAEFHAVVRQQGLAVAEWRILASLYDVEGLPVGRLAEIVLAPQSTVTRQLDRMEAKGLVTREAATDDRRVVLARITPEGLALARTLVERARAHEREVLAPFGIEHGEDLKQMLKQLIEAPRR